jgi:hypothetical protein
MQETDERDRASRGDARERVRAAAYVDFLENRERRFTEGFVMAEAERRASEPHLRLLAIFDAFDGSYRRDDCEGCSFINVTRSREWHILMKGAMVAAGEGDRDAARRARRLGALLLREQGFDVAVPGSP